MSMKKHVTHLHFSVLLRKPGGSSSEFFLLHPNPLFAEILSCLHKMGAAGSVHGSLPITREDLEVKFNPRRFRRHLSLSLSPDLEREVGTGAKK